MTTITLEVSDDLAKRLTPVGDRLPDLLSFALDMAGIPDRANVPTMPLLPVMLEAIDFLASRPTQQEIIKFKLSSVAQMRLEDLLHLSREGELTPSEQEELNTFQQINHLFILLKARTRNVLAS